MVLLSIVSGAVFFPLLLPWLPTKDFSTKGWSLGIVVTLAVVLADMLWWNADTSTIHKTLSVVSNLLIWPPVVAFIALNFTGSTPFTSRTGVKKEIFRYVPVMAAMAGSGAVLAVLAGALRLLGVV